MEYAERSFDVTQVYVAKENDTPRQIARALGVSMEHFMAYNATTGCGVNLKPSSKFRSGTVVYVPPAPRGGTRRARCPRGPSDFGQSAQVRGLTLLTDALRHVLRHINSHKHVSMVGSCCRAFNEAAGCPSVWQSIFIARFGSDIAQHVLAGGHPKQQHSAERAGAGCRGALVGQSVNPPLGHFIPERRAMQGASFTAEDKSMHEAGMHEAGVPPQEPSERPGGKCDGKGILTSGSLGSALRILNMMVWEDQADEEYSKPFELRLPGRADREGFTGRLTRDLETVDATDFRGTLGVHERPAALACRFTSPMRWAVACKQLLDNKPCKGLSIKPYIFFEGKNLLQHEARLRAARLEEESVESCDHPATKSKATAADNQSSGIRIRPWSRRDPPTSRASSSNSSCNSCNSDGKRSSAETACAR